MKTHIFMFSNSPLLRNLAVYEIIWKKYDVSGLATYDNIKMAYALCMLGN